MGFLEPATQNPTHTANSGGIDPLDLFVVEAIRTCPMLSDEDKAKILAMVQTTEH